VHTLCIARRVCTRFRVAASWFIHSVKLSATQLCFSSAAPRFSRSGNFRSTTDVRGLPDINLSNFPNLTWVCTFGVQEYHLRLLTWPGIRDVVTHVDLVQTQVPAPLLPPLPNLTSLTVREDSLDQGFCQSFAFPATLQQLYLDGIIAPADAEALTTLTRLTTLHITLRFDMQEEEEEIYICSSRLGLIKMDHHHSGNGRNSQQ
jgi:hypothetical protein